MQALALAEPGEHVGDLVGGVRAVVDPMASREDVGRMIEEHRLSDLAVVDLDGRLIGVIRHASMVEAEKERASVGIQTMVGVSRDERATSKVSFAVRKRLPWLQINLVTAFVAASVVGLFESTIAQYTALAVLLPVVAGQSGNTGAQALAVTMRGLALREIRASQWARVVLKETNVGFLNGLTVALTTAIGVLVWSGSYGLALIHRRLDGALDGDRRHRRCRDTRRADGARTGSGTVVLHRSHDRDRRHGILQLPRDRGAARRAHLARLRLGPTRHVERHLTSPERRPAVPAAASNLHATSPPVKTWPVESWLNRQDPRWSRASGEAARRTDAR